MDEIEFVQSLMELTSVVDKVTAPETKHALQIVQRLLSSLNERMLELQAEEEDDE